MRHDYGDTVNPADLQALQEGDLADREEHLYDLINRARSGDDGTAAALRHMISHYSDFHPGLVSRALNQATVFGDASLEQPLLALLTDRDFQCEPWGAMGCADLGFTAAIPMLIPMLDDDRWIAREQAIIGLGMLGDASTVPILAPLLGDSDPYTREAAAAALGTIGGDAAYAALWAELEHRRFQRIGHIASALATFTPRVIPDLIGMATNGDADQRYWAAIALGSTGDDEVIPTLERIMADDEGVTVFDGWVRVAAKKGLRTLRRIQAAVAARTEE